jgi:AraC-like DNA-binding protein
MRPTKHAYHKLLYITSGEGELQAADRRVELKPGILCYVPPKREHQLQDHPQRPVSLLVACFSSEFLERALVLSGEQAPNWPPLTAMPLHNAYYREHIEQCLLAILFEQSEQRPGWQSASTGHYLTLLAFHQRALAEAPPVNGDLQRCVTWLEHHFDQQMSVEELAKTCGLSYRRFTEQFKKLTGASAVAFQSRLRIHHACRLLESGAAIAEAARATGYSDMTHFYRQFKQHVGAAPGRWLERQSGIKR